MTQSVVRRLLNRGFESRKRSFKIRLRALLISARKRGAGVEENSSE